MPGGVPHTGPANSSQDTYSVLDGLPDSVERGFRERIIGDYGARLALAYKTGDQDSLNDLARDIAFQKNKIEGLTDISSSAAGLKEIADAKGFWDTTVAAIKNIDAVASVAGTAAAYVGPTIAMGVGVGAVTGGVGGMAVGALDAAWIEGGNAVLRTLEEKGVDLHDPEAIKRAFADEKLMEAAAMKGAFTGAVTGATSVASFGVGRAVTGVSQGVRIAATAANFSDDTVVLAQRTTAAAVLAGSNAAINAGTQYSLNGEVSTDKAVLSAIGAAGSSTVSRVMSVTKEGLAEAKQIVADSSKTPVGSQITLEDSRVISDKFKLMAESRPEDTAPAPAAPAAAPQQVATGPVNTFKPA